MVRRYRGVISYGHETEGRTGQEIFYVTVHDDGSRTLRTISEMDKVPLVRDVVYTVNDKFEAMDCFVRVVDQGAFVGSGWFRFTDDMAEGEIITAAEGRISQRIATPGRVKLFGSHPLSVDIWKCTHTPTDRPGEIIPLTNCFSSSLVPNGASGPRMATKSYDVIYEGPEQYTTPAGTFDCLKYNWNTYTGRTLVMHTVPGDWLPVSVRVPETGRVYELIEYEVLD